MRIYLKVRQFALVVLFVALAAALLIPAGSRVVPLPGLRNAASLGLPLALFVPVIIAIALVSGLAAGDSRLDATAARPLPMIDAVYGAMVAFMGLAAYGVVWIITGDAWSVYPLGAGRNALGYVGLAMIGRALAGPRVAGLFPVAAAIGSALIGFHADGTARWWAWPVAEARDEASWVMASLILVLGIAATTMSRRTSVAE